MSSRSLPPTFASDCPLSDGYARRCGRAFNSGKLIKARWIAERARIFISLNLYIKLLCNKFDCCSSTLSSENLSAILRITPRCYTWSMHVVDKAPRTVQRPTAVAIITEQNRSLTELSNLGKRQLISIAMPDTNELSFPRTWTMNICISCVLENWISLGRRRRKSSWFALDILCEHVW